MKHFYLFHEKFWSRESPEVLIFVMRQHIVVYYQLCSRKPLGSKVCPTPGVTILFFLISCPKPQVQDPWYVVRIELKWKFAKNILDSQNVITPAILFKTCFPTSQNDVTFVGFAQVPSSVKRCGVLLVHINKRLQSFWRFFIWQLSSRP